MLRPSYTSALFFLVTLIHLAGMTGIDIMDVDAAQYASISMEMAENENFLQVQHRGADYLDKPPFLFWITSLSFKLFGLGNFSYRLPSFLFILLGTWSVFRMGKLLYSRAAGVTAALIFYSCQAVFLVVHDVRTDTILISTVIFAVWQLYLFCRTQKLPSLLWGFAGIAVAMLEKGPIGLMVPVLALGSQLIYEKNWKQLFSPWWLLGMAFTAILLVPMCWGLYHQFDLHPEKVTNGVKGESGLRFFFWTQSFGRLTGENVWKNDTGPFFFVHTLLWSFLPYTLLGLVAFFTRLKQLFAERFSYKTGAEVLTAGGFILPFIALSLSHYKLPHYIFITFPFLALLTGQWLESRAGARLRTLAIVQVCTIVLLWAGILLITCWVFPMAQLTKWLVLLILMGLVILAAVQKDAVIRLLFGSVLTAVAVNFVMNTHFYPTLLTYQAGSQAARYLKEQNADLEKVYQYKAGAHSFDFYTGRITPYFEPSQTTGDGWVFTNSEGREELRRAGVSIAAEKDFPSTGVTMLTGRFLHPATREPVLEHRYLLRLSH